MNYTNDLDGCLNILNYISNLSNFMILFYGLPNILSHLNQLLSKKVPKLLESYNTKESPPSYKI